MRQIQDKKWQDCFCSAVAHKAVSPDSFSGHSPSHCPAQWAPAAWLCAGGEHALYTSLGLTVTYELLLVSLWPHVSSLEP